MISEPFSVLAEAATAMKIVIIDQWDEMSRQEHEALYEGVFELLCVVADRAGQS